ncbi:class I SAM-dependent DNA methyltransferase [Chryseobacterium sp. CH1]|uniref:HsdM family class I SAM-dependent methyltransferase n=1 Tax=Chryseobacterium sp. CH1 TaxID=713551 RepID=UPI001E2B27F7|nr:N-6 DNA methylase [Chryseobacterium sp. CH1]
MKVNILRYLRDYSTKPLLIDRLLISSFLYINSLENIRNTFLSSFKISEKDVDYQNLVDFVSILSKDSDQFFIEDLIELFEFVISPSDRIVNGAIYTPSGIREYIVEEVLARDGIDFETVKIADIACGCAGFLFTAAKELKVRSGLSYYNIFQNQIFGLDIQSYSVARSKMLLTLLAISAGEDCEEFQFNLYQGDTLKFKWQDHYENFNGFEIIVGNPPYVCGRNLEDSVKENLINWSVSKSGNPDLYIPFFQIGYENLSANGALGFITMNTFFKSLNGRALRKYFEDNKTSIRIIDFGTLQIFKSKSTYTCICFLEKRESTNIEYYRSIQKELPSEDEFQLISYKNLDAKKGWNLHYNEIISKIESVGKPFGDLYRTRHGIATLRNDLFIFEPVAEDDDFFTYKMEIYIQLKETYVVIL